MFLGILKKVVIDVPFQAEIIADPGANPPIVGVPEVAEVSHIEVIRSYIEESGAQVTMNLEAGVPFADYYQIQFNGAQLQATIRPVRLRSGTRTPGPVREVIEVEAADGTLLGSAVVDA